MPDRALADLPFTLPALHAAYAEGVTPAEVLAEVFARIDAADDPAMFIHLDRDDALRQTAAIGPRDAGRPLWSIPFAVKDNIDVAGMPTTAACPAFAYPADTDAFVVARLRAAGAIVIGKTNLDQFATGLVGVRSPYGVPRNALDAQIVPGGSSSGSAVAVARGIVPFALGTDTAGSGRVPAALNGIVGLKPTLGLLSAGGMVPACRTLDTISVFAATVADAHAVTAIAAAFDPADAYARDIPLRPLSPPLPHPRLTIPDDKSLRVFGDDAQADSFRRTCDSLSGAGAILTEVDFSPFYEVAHLLYDGAWVAERYAAIEPLIRAQPAAIHPVTLAIIRRAEGMSAADAFRGLYRLEALKRACAPILAAADALLVPTIPTFYTLADLAADPVTPNSNLGTYTNFVNLLNLCAIAVPTGPRRDGRAGSVTLIGAAGRDAMLAAEGERIVALSGGDQPPARTTAVAGDEIAIAVCGAHMSGLPLNHELTSRGARFLCATASAPAYRLYALAGGPPQRPGMVRVAEGGQSIAVEVWAMPLAAFGRFMAGIPAPLAIGTITLADGTPVKGFTCEAAGTEGATDISAHGGWRAFLAG